MATELLSGLGYEQCLALIILTNNPGIKGDDLAKDADCSMDDLFALGVRGYLEPGFDQLPYGSRFVPVLTSTGHKAAEQAKEFLFRQKGK